MEMKTQSAFKSQSGKNDVLKYYDLLIEQWAFAHEIVNAQTRYGNTFI